MQSLFFLCIVFFFLMKTHCLDQPFLCWNGERNAPSYKMIAAQDKV
ncbi:hypothetical protein TGS27_2156 [Geobacillus stearothermophilus]|nr:hypothetical protein TGS27_2156 [Geobacillus stearothermophilus]